MPTPVPFSTDGKKRCGKCRQYLPPTDFYKTHINPSGLTCYCRRCTLEEQRQRRIARPRAWKNMRLQNEYGITMAQYEALSAAQDHRCAICDQPEQAVHHRGTKKQLSVDHCHDTGRVRGLLCGRCNRGLGFFGNSGERLEKAIAYLRRTA